MLDDDGVRDLKIVSLGHFWVNSFRHNVRILKSNANKTGCIKITQSKGAKQVRVPISEYTFGNSSELEYR